MKAYSHVVVDEAQDMSPAQIMLAQILAGYDVTKPILEQTGGRLTKVGDDCQAIYGFRGADSGILGRAANELNAKVLNLNITYRCPKSIVELAQFYVPDFHAAPEAPQGEVHEGVLPELMRELAGPGDAVLCFANAPLMGECLKFIADGKRAYMKGRDVGEKLMGILRKVQGRKAFMDMADLLQRLERWAQKEKERIARTTKNPKDAESKLEAIDDIFGIFEALANGLEEPTQIEGELKRLFQEPGLTNKDFICCSTVHKAKGLEWDNVFILKQGWNRQGDECDNIRYVAITRAKKRLYGVGLVFGGGQPSNLEQALKQAQEEAGEVFPADAIDTQNESADLDQDFSEQRLESDQGEVVFVGGDFSGKYHVTFGQIASGFADNWREVGDMLDAWLPGREWQVDGVAWKRESIFASAQKHVPLAYASSEAL